MRVTHVAEDEKILEVSRFARFRHVVVVYCKNPLTTLAGAEDFSLSNEGEEG